ncbi:hypothetical protein D0Z00_002912 [Geotrichum galactomycetum]|uniref:Uncharacterized protein n=1 Tax=Geotrichum galactomycetum TaxID=27317 RepID=A0ACB6V2S1_9ASCO|nr:hypothetical protein D0Z00_002912 [Geotrichum candidum]
MSSIIEKAQNIANEFVLSEGFLDKAVEQFVEQTKAGLEKQTDRGMPMIPAFVTSIPSGKEKGTFLAIDLGGTNFRVCSVTLNGDSTFSIIQEKEAIPDSLMKSTSKLFVSHLVDRIEKFLRQHHCDTVELACEQDSTVKEFKLGFTFSFPVNQTAINRGTLIRWTKGYDIKDMVGKDVVELVQSELDARRLPVHISALVNDTVGTLMSRAYTKPTGGQTLVGCIFGTGTNGAYSEKVSHIPKFTATHPNYLETATSKIMLVNTEWGSFDNDMKVLPNTKYDVQVNLNSPNPNYHMFEKRVSGMFLGELLRLCLVDLFESGDIFVAEKDSFKVDELNRPWALDTSVPSLIDGDGSADLTKTAEVLKKHLGLLATTLEERKAVQILSKAIGRRSAYLSAVPCAGLILHTNALRKFDTIDIGADGSVVEFYPNFQPMMHEALRSITKIGVEGNAKIHIGNAKDGSGIGAALCALVA